MILLFSFIFGFNSIAAEINNSSFAKIVDGVDGYARLMVASKTYREASSGLKVILLGASHFGNQAFFDRHNEMALLNK